MALRNIRIPTLALRTFEADLDFQYRKRRVVSRT